MKAQMTILFLTVPTLLFSSISGDNDDQTSSRSALLFSSLLSCWMTRFLRRSLLLARRESPWLWLRRKRWIIISSLLQLLYILQWRHFKRRSRTLPRNQMLFQRIVQKYSISLPTAHENCQLLFSGGDGLQIELLRLESKQLQNYRMTQIGHACLSLYQEEGDSTHSSLPDSHPLPLHSHTQQETSLQTWDHIQRGNATFAKEENAPKTIWAAPIARKPSEIIDLSASGSQLKKMMMKKSKQICKKTSKKASDELASSAKLQRETVHIGVYYEYARMQRCRKLSEMSLGQMEATRARYLDKVLSRKIEEMANNVRYLRNSCNRAEVEDFALGKERSRKWVERKRKEILRRRVHGLSEEDDLE